MSFHLLTLAKKLVLLSVFFVIITKSNYLYAQAIDKSKPVGSIDGQVNIASGASTYTIPIVVPQGTSNIQPNISLTYNSQAGDGAAG